MFETMYTFSTREEFRNVRETIQKEIQDILGCNESFLMDVAINEAVNNGLESNKEKRPMTITLRVTSGNRLIIRVKDQGSGFNGNEVLSQISSSKEILFEDRLLDESGRGLSIMKYASDKMFYNRIGNEILLMKYVDQNHVLLEAEGCQKYG